MFCMKTFFATLVLLNSHCNHQLHSPVDYDLLSALKDFVLEGATDENTENMGDFIVLSQIEKNLDTDIFWELLILLKKEKQ